MSQIEAPIKNEWIEECGGLWGISIMLAAKSHQEQVPNIEDFIWRIYVSYQKLNEITKPFEFTILRCDDAIRSVGTSSDNCFITSLDDRQGYHQVQACKIYKEKLAFFDPNRKK